MTFCIIITTGIYSEAPLPARILAQQEFNVSTFGSEDLWT
jgi:hypothetical protein